MTFYTTFTTADGIKAAYIYQTKRQLIAADQSGTFKAMQEVKHNKAEAGIKAIKAHLQNNGYKVLRPVYEESRKEKAAADFIEAIKTLASKPENLENLQFYLEQHFPVWMKKFAYDPDCLAAEMKEFANMEI